jgi:hypothetical protein
MSRVLTFYVLQPTLSSGMRWKSYTTDGPVLSRWSEVIEVMMMAQSLLISLQSSCSPRVPQISFDLGLQNSRHNYPWLPSLLRQLSPARVKFVRNSLSLFHLVQRRRQRIGICGHAGLVQQIPRRGQEDQGPQAAHRGRYAGQSAGGGGAFGGHPGPGGRALC